MNDQQPPAHFQPGDPMLLVDERDRQFLITVPAEPLSEAVKGERFDSPTLCALHDGDLLVSPQRRRYLVFKPTLEEVVMNMPRAAQVIYPKDLGSLLIYGDVHPGLRVSEVGCGHGALTMTLLRALGPQGRLTTYDLRRDHLNRTRKNIALYLGPEMLERWEPILADPSQEGMAHKDQDRLFTDVPEPWTMLEAAACCLRPGAVWVAYVPTVGQMSQLMENIKAHREFCLPKCFETLQRYWHVRAPSVRPNHAMRGHTGFIITCRRRWHGEPRPPQKTGP